MSNQSNQRHSHESDLSDAISKLHDFNYRTAKTNPSLPSITKSNSTFHFKGNVFSLIREFMDQLQTPRTRSICDHNSNRALIRDIHKKHRHRLESLVIANQQSMTREIKLNIDKILDPSLRKGAKPSSGNRLDPKSFNTLTRRSLVEACSYQPHDKTPEVPVFSGSLAEHGLGQGHFGLPCLHLRGAAGQSDFFLD